MGLKKKFKNTTASHSFNKGTLEADLHKSSFPAKFPGGETNWEGSCLGKLVADLCLGQITENWLERDQADENRKEVRALWGFKETSQLHLMWASWGLSLCLLALSPAPGR